MKAPALLWLTCLLLAACSKQPAAPQTQLSGQIVASAPLTLPAGAQLQLRLADVSSDEAATAEVATLTTAIKALPHSYVLPFDAARIRNTHRYMVEARIVIDGQPRYGTDTPHPVLTEGHDRQRDIQVVELGAAGSSLANNNAMPETIFRGELRANNDVTLYSAGLRQSEGRSQITWIKEERAAGKQLQQTTYELKGAYLLRYRDASGLQIEFDDHGKPVKARRNNQMLAISEVSAVINTARSRVALLRSHALAAMETQQHRDETEDPAKLAGMQLKLNQPR